DMLCPGWLLHWGTLPGKGAGVRGKGTGPVEGSANWREVSQPGTGAYASAGSPFASRRCRQHQHGVRAEFELEETEPTERAESVWVAGSRWQPIPYLGRLDSAGAIPNAGKGGSVGKGKPRLFDPESGISLSARSFVQYHAPVEFRHGAETEVCNNAQI